MTHQSVYAVDVFLDDSEGLYAAPESWGASNTWLTGTASDPPPFFSAIHQVVNEHNGDRLREADLFYVSIFGLALTNDAADALKDLLPGTKQIVPLACPDLDGILAHVLQRTDLLDLDACIVKNGDRLDRFAFRSDALEDIHLFSLGRKQVVPFFVDQIFVDRCTEHALAGVRFWRVWTTDPSLDVVPDLIAAMFPDDEEK